VSLAAGKRRRRRRLPRMPNPAPPMANAALASLPESSPVPHATGSTRRLSRRRHRVGRPHRHRAPTRRRPVFDVPSRGCRASCARRGFRGHRAPAPPPPSVAPPPPSASRGCCRNGAGPRIRTGSGPYVAPSECSRAGSGKAAILVIASHLEARASRSRCWCRAASAGGRRRGGYPVASHSGERS
jgi:hypothetical protein